MEHLKQIQSRSDPEKCIKYVCRAVCKWYSESLWKKNNWGSGWYQDRITTSKIRTRRTHRISALSRSKRTFIFLLLGKKHFSTPDYTVQVGQRIDKFVGELNHLCSRLQFSLLNENALRPGKYADIRPSDTNETKNTSPITIRNAHIFDILQINIHDPREEGQIEFISILDIKDANLGDYGFDEI